MTTTPIAAAPPLYVARQGEGSPVVMLHCSSGSWQQWKPLMQTLQGDRVECLALDLHGHGRSPEWPLGERDTLAVDAAAAWQSLGVGAREVQLVGHSYGAAVAMQMALMQPSRVSSMTLYEPVPFGLLQADDPLQAPHRLEIETIAMRVASLVDPGRLYDAAKLFTNYWADGDAWAAANAAQRDRLASRMPSVSRHFNALFAARWSCQQLRRLTMPVLLMHGTRTREPSRALAWQLSTQLPRVTNVPLPGAGHLGPISHSDVVASYFAARIRQQRALHGRRAAVADALAA